MRKQIFYILFVTAIFLFSCSQKKENLAKAELNNDSIESKHDIGWAFDSMKVNKKVYLDNDSNKSGMDINLYFKFPISAPSNVNISSVQNIFSKIFSNTTSNLSLKESFNFRLKDFEEAAQYDALEWKDNDNIDIDFDEYYRSLSVSINDTIHNYVITLFKGESSYLGGAHGAYFITYYNIDLHKNEIIKEDIFFKENYKSELAKLIQNEVTRRNDLDNEDEHIPLIINVDKISPNGNFYFSKEGMVYNYNQYEIAPYIAGCIEILIPYKQIIPLVGEDYKSFVTDLSK